MKNGFFNAGKMDLDLPEDELNFLVWINGLSITVRYPEDLRKMAALYTKEQTARIYQQTKTAQQWIKTL